MTGTRRALWVSTSTQTRGGIATYVTTMQGTSLWANWNVRHVVTHRDGSAATKIAAFASGTIDFIMQLFRFRPSVVHVHASADASFTRKCTLFWIARVAGVPVVMHMHGSDFWDYHQRSSRLVQAVIRGTLQRAAAVVALGEAWAGQLRQIAPGARISVVPNGVQPGGLVAQPAPDEPVHVVFLGRIGERKGTFRLLEAWAKLMVELDAIDPGRGAVDLTIAGDGDVEQARRRIGELGVGDSVRLHDWLPQSRVHALLDGAHVLVLPSRNEGQPMAVLEAMSRGLCVIASDAGGLGEMIGGGCGVIVPPDDIGEIVDALRLVVTDHALREHCGAAARERVSEQFDADVVARRIDELYRKVAR